MCNIPTLTSHETFAVRNECKNINALVLELLLLLLLFVIVAFKSLF